MSTIPMRPLMPTSARTRHSILQRYHAEHSRRSLQHFAHWAYHHVPFYRESFSSASELYEPRPLLVPDMLATQAFRLFPFTRPFYGTEKYMHQLRVRDNLFSTLLLSGRYEPRIPLFELQTTLLDLPFLAPFLRGRRYSLLSPNAITNPLEAYEQIINGGRGPDDRHYLQAVATYYLLGSVADLTSWLQQRLSSANNEKTNLVMPQQLFARLSCSDVEHEINGQAVYEMKVLEASLAYYPVLFEENIGYFGAYVPECQHYHLNWQHVLVNNSPEGIVFTRLARYGPVLLHYQPVEGKNLSVQLCPSHHSPILVSRSESDMSSSVRSTKAIYKERTFT